MSLSRVVRHPSRPGFLLVEVLIGITVFALFLAAVSTVLLRGQESTQQAGDYARAVYLAEESIEAARAIRDGGFSNLTVGAHGVRVAPDGTWGWNGTKTVSSGAYVTTIAVTAPSTARRQVAAATKWKHGYSRSGSVVLTTEFDDWRTERAVGDWASASLAGSYVAAGTPLFNDVAVAGNYAYVTSGKSAGGAGLYVFDITSLSAPTRVASAFSLSGTGYGVAVRGSRLYVAVAAPSAEIQVYDIASPAALSAAKLVASYDLPGSALIRTLTLRGTTLYVGAKYTTTSGQNQFYTFDVSNSGSVVPKASAFENGDINGIALSGTSAYLGSSIGTYELRVYDVSNPASPARIGNANLSAGTQQAMSIALAGTSALLGRMRNAAGPELVLFDAAGGGVPAPPPGPWTYEASGSVLGLDVDPTACFAFVGNTWAPRALQVVNLENHAMTLLTSYVSTSGPARGLRYDVVRDAVYLLTQKGFLIFRPGASPSPCQ